MEINRNNYEIYILDYIEGNLPLDIRKDFDCFLSKNPEIKSGINDFEQIQLEPVSVSYSAKGLLKKDPIMDIVGLSKFEQMSIARLENEINQTETDELNKIIANSVAKQKEFEIFQKTKLIPDYSIKYKFKNQLKHNNLFTRKAFYYFTGIAASIVLFIGIAVFYQSSGSKNIGQALSYNSHIKNHIPKSIHHEVLVDTTFYFTKSEKIQKQAETLVIDSTTVNYLNSKQLASIEIAKSNELKMDIENIVNYQSTAKNINSDDYMTFRDFLNKKFKENVLKQQASEKATFASVGKAISRGLSKILRKDIRLDEKVMEDGSKLYAFKAGSFEMFTNTRPSKKEEQNQNEKGQNKPNLLKE